LLGDFGDLAEDGRRKDAFPQPLQQWPKDRPARQSAGWLVATGRNGRHSNRLRATRF